MIKLDDRFFLDADDRNIIVLELKVYEDGKKKGEEYKDAIAYCSTPKSAINYIYRKLVREKIGNKKLIQTFTEYEKEATKIEKAVEKMLEKTK